ncbi:MAG: methyltransferase [Bacteroidetes bacterium]|nr:methyltransferase [Bacteroidota bacterium]
MSTIFRFKQFAINQENASLKVGTDAMVLGAFCSFPAAEYALDVGTGTGVLSLMVAQTHPNLFIHAIDIDEQNCLLAKENVQNSPFYNRISVIHEDIFKFSTKNKYDLIFSNPPFHFNSLKSIENRISQAKHLSIEQFDGFIGRLSKLLSKKGKIIMIIRHEHLDDISSCLNKHKLFLNEIILIFGKPASKKRLIITCSNSTSSFEEKEFTIRDSFGRFSKEYIEKTKEFHFTKL